MDDSQVKTDQQHLENLPQVYWFPPLYTRQPNALVRRQQIEAWCNIILQYCQSNGFWTLTSQGEPIAASETSSSVKTRLFHNDKLQRTVVEAFVTEIWQSMCSENKAIAAGQDSYYILWKSSAVWSSILLEWFESSGKLNQVVTLYELCQGDETAGWAFHGMPEELMAICAKELCSQGRGTLLFDGNTAVGVKVV